MSDDAKPKSKASSVSAFMGKNNQSRPKLKASPKAIPTAASFSSTPRSASLSRVQSASSPPRSSSSSSNSGNGNHSELGQLVARLEALASSHEILLSAHAALLGKHEDLMARHEALMVVHDYPLGTPMDGDIGCGGSSPSPARTRVALGRGTSDLGPHREVRVSASEPRGSLPPAPTPLHAAYPHAAHSRAQAAAPPSSRPVLSAKAMPQVPRRLSSAPREPRDGGGGSSSSSSSSSFSLAHAHARLHGAAVAFAAPAAGSPASRLPVSRLPSSAALERCGRTGSTGGNTGGSTGGSTGGGGGSSSSSGSSNHAPAEGHALRVCVRKRPAKEGETDCVECADGKVRAGLPFLFFFSAFFFSFVSFSVFFSVVP